MTLKNKFYSCLKVLIPAGIWGFLCQSFLFGSAVISSETFYVYSIVKFYIDNLRTGVFPLWNPFTVWGTPTQIFLNYVGVYNPFWLLIVVFDSLALSFYQSFVFTIAVYFGVGLWGFYLLARMILQDARAAYFAFLLFAFSSLSLTVFLQVHPPLVYIPSVWFFFFLFSFFKNPKRSNWLGLIFSSCLILTSYLPFYFLTVMIIVGVLVPVFCFGSFKNQLRGVFKFIRTRACLVTLSLGILAISLVPGFLAYQSTVHREVVAPFRNGLIEKGSGVDFTQYSRISVNALTARMEAADLYSNLDAIQYGDDSFFYVSIFFYIILAAGAFVRINRKIFICGTTAVILFFLMITNASGVHRFLFEHVSFFKLIRNMHFFLPYFLGALILMAAEGLRLIFERREILRERYKWVFLSWIVLLHAGIWFFLYGRDAIILSSYLSVGLSFLFWVFFITCDEKNKSGEGQRFFCLPPVFLFLCVMAQPIEVIWRHNQFPFVPFYYPKTKTIERSVQTPCVKPEFSYTRPVSPEEMDNDDISHCRVIMKDAPRFYTVEFPTYWSFYLTQAVPFDVAQKHTANKFYLYDRVEILEKDADLKGLISSLDSQLNAAFVSSEGDLKELSVFQKRTPQEIPPRVSVVLGPSEQFKVVYFDVNSIKIHTNLSSEKFLVYTDSFDKHWKAFINGKSAALYRANLAFKGIRLPQGDNEVYLRYLPHGTDKMPFLIIFIFMGMLILLLISLKKRVGGSDSGER